MIRKAAVAGSFYPRDPRELKEWLDRLLVPGRKKDRAYAVVSPHAGYQYSGAVAGAVFSSVVLPDAFIIMAPSHRPIRSLFAIMKEGSWETPLGEFKVDAELAEALAAGSDLIRIDPSAHDAEHSLEVQLPFIQAQKIAPTMVPVAISHLARYEQIAELGRAAAAAVRRAGRDVLLVASTDMSHYISAEEARLKDFLAIQKILDLDPRGLFETVRGEEISMCGFQPTAAVLAAAKELGATRGELVMYATSGDQTGDCDAVVGYAGLKIL
jgi:AmmeMemoRadiSam system protein B